MQEKKDDITAYMQPELPIIEESIDLSDYQIETDEGWVDIKEMHKTVPYDQWYIQTESGKFLICADLHRLYNENFEVRYAKELTKGDIIQTKDGPEVVVIIENRGNPENMYDFTLADDSNHRFYANDILSHNSTNMGLRTILFCNLLPRLRVATIVPRSDQLKTIADKYFEVDKAYRFKASNSKARDNLYYKEFIHKNGSISQMRLWYILTNADKIRGNTYDWIDYDEYQDFDDSLNEVIQQTQSRSHIRSITYSGTSKTTDSALEAQWLRSSRGEWRMTCPACHFDNYPTIEHGVMDMIQPDGLCCKKCGHKLDVRDGHWDFEAPEMLNIGAWGFHVPQIIVPANHNRASWVNIYTKSRTVDIKSFMEEYLGEATEEGSKEITTKDLQRMCMLGNMEQVQKVALEKPQRKYNFLVSGVDWGGADYNPATKTKTSYTCHVILGALPTGDIDLIYAQSYAGMDWESVGESIAAVHHKFNCSALGGDHGGGAVYINCLRKHIDPLKVLAFKYAGPLSPFLSIPKESANYGNMYSLNRTEALTATILDIKNARLRAPQWEQTSRFLLQILNLSRVPSETSVGANTLKYIRNPTKADDFFHALTYALIMVKLLRGEPLFEDMTKQRMVYNYMKFGVFTPPVSFARRGHAISG
jgi:hypothetical protein